MCFVNRSHKDLAFVTSERLDHPTLMANFYRSRHESVTDLVVEAVLDADSRAAGLSRRGLSFPGIFSCAWSYGQKYCPQKEKKEM